MNNFWTNNFFTPYYTLARTTDPITSHLAAEEVEQFASKHHARILTALDRGDGTVFEIATRTGISAHAVGKRMAELQNNNLVTVVDGLFGVSPSGRKCRVWKLQ